MNGAKDRELLLGAIAELRRYVAADEGTQSWLTKAEAEMLLAVIARATYVAEHLWQMVDRETWRAAGGDDGQGHYEGDYYAEQVRLEIEAWKESVRV